MVALFFYFEMRIGVQVFIYHRVFLLDRGKRKLIKQKICDNFYYL